ncbi:hypothetical protein SH501x_003259 [Pirellulaceae bacterium SH501]
MTRVADSVRQQTLPSRSISAHLATHSAIAIGQLFLFSLAMYGWILLIAPILGPAAFLIAGFLAWASLRVHSTWFLLFLLAISWCTQGTPGRSQAWFESIQLAAWAGCLFAWRTHYQTLHQRLSQRILSTKLPAQPGASATNRSSFSYFAKLALRGGLTILLAIGLATLSAVLLGKNPMLEGRRGWSRWVQGLDGTLWPNPELIVACIAVAIVLREWQWRQLRPDEASISIRAQAVQWFLPDLKRTILLSRKYRSRKTTLPSDNQTPEQS